MAVAWSWAFGSEIGTTLIQMGFGINNTNFTSPLNAAGQVYTYTGSPGRYSFGLGDGRIITFPVDAGISVNKGWFCAPIKSIGGGSSYSWNQFSNLLTITSNGRAFLVKPTNFSGGTAAFALYVDSVFKGSSLLNYDFQNWQYLALKFDASTATHSAELYVDGVSVVGPFTDAAVAATSSTFSMQCVFSSAIPPTGFMIGQVIIYDDTADAGQTPRFVTRVEPNADGTDVGTWTPTGAATNWQAVDSPFDATTYTEDAAAVIGDRMEVLTSGGGSDLATALGTTPTVIDAVTHHNYSSGATVSAKAIVGDGTSETSGGSSVIGPSTTYLYANAPIRPSGGAWTGTDAPTLVYEVV